MNPIEHVPNEQQEQVVTLLRQGGEMAESVAQTLFAIAPLLKELPDTWYDWPCDRHPYPATCNTTDGVAELCTWCQMQAARPYAAGYREGLVAADAEPKELPAKKATPRKRTTKKPTAKQMAQKRAAARLAQNTSEPAANESS